LSADEIERLLRLFSPLMRGDARFGGAVSDGSIARYCRELPVGKVDVIGLTYLFFAQGVTFQNRDPFSADDVVYTINTITRDKRVAIPAYVAGKSGQA
jgi:hypothetical protein